MSEQQYSREYDPFAFLTTQEKVERLKECYRIADGYRMCGEYSYLYGHEGDQVCRLLSEYLQEIQTRDDVTEIEQLCMDVYNVVKQYYHNFLGLLNSDEGWTEYIRSYVPSEE